MIVPNTCSESAANDATEPLRSVITCSGKPTSRVAPVNDASALRILSASASWQSWFMSIVCRYSPVAKGMPRFWFSGLPSPTMGKPGRRTRCVWRTAPEASATRRVTNHASVADVTSSVASSATDSRCAVTTQRCGFSRRSCSSCSSFSSLPSVPYTCAHTTWLYLAMTRGSMSASGTPSSRASTRVASAYDAMPRAVRSMVCERPLAHSQISRSRRLFSASDDVFETSFSSSFKPAATSSCRLCSIDS
mmetsp:Transcript_11851/g.49670  ORF Transcript_11851/g.49670 Transcript_11851/m.49670 type:complete len:249 (+) Transcript_11851:2935-3681(+)